MQISARFVVITHLMALSSSLSINRTLILELQNCDLTLLQIAVCSNPELVVPRLTCTSLSLSWITITIRCEPITLGTIYNHFSCVNSDVNGLWLLISCTLEHLKCHRLVLCVKINLPNTKTRKIQLSIGRCTVLLPILRIVLNLALRLQCSALEGLIVTTSSRNHNLVNVRSGITLLTKCSNIVCSLLIPFELNSIVQIVV